MIAYRDSEVTKNGIEAAEKGGKEGRKSGGIRQEISSKLNF